MKIHARILGFFLVSSIVAFGCAASDDDPTEDEGTADDEGETVSASGESALTGVSCQQAKNSCVHTCASLGYKFSKGVQSCTDAGKGKCVCSNKSGRAAHIY